MNAIVQLNRDLEAIQDRFAKANPDMPFTKELSFAIQALSNNEYLAKVAEKNRNSLRSSVMNVASIGLSLNPALGHSYLVPRDNKVILDVSYKGLVELGTRTGGIVSASAEIVYTNDEFRWNGKHALPDHDFDPFGDPASRGEFRGVYAIAQLPSGSFLLEKMSAAEIEKVRSISSSYASWKAGKSKSCIWNDWFEPMCLKSCIKKAAKTWPGSSTELSQAIQYLNQDLGEGIVQEKTINPEAAITEDRQFAIRKAVMSAFDRASDEGGAYGAGREWLKGKFQGGERDFAINEFNKIVESTAQHN